MAPLAVDPEAMYAAGRAVVAIGDGLAASLTVLTTGFSAHTGIDLAGEVFGLAYQDAAKSLLKAAAAAVNACRKIGALIQQGATNYSNVDAASTLGGGGGVLKPPSSPAELAAPGPPGTMGPGEPAPSLWWLVQSLVHDVWPDGDVAGLHAAAAHWRGFGAAVSGVQGTLNASKTLLDTQHIPEADLIDHALTEMGTAAKAIGEQCGKLATTIDNFANRVDHAQHAIRDLLHRLESLADIGHDVMLIIEGKALDEVEKIAKDINDVLQQLGQEARAYEQGIKLVMQAADAEIVKGEKYARRALVQFLGDDVGNPVATVFDTWINAHQGVLKDAVGMGLSLGDLSPHWFFVDPQGAAATWTGTGKGLWKGSLFNAAVNPQEFADARLQELKNLVHFEDWSAARPGLGAGENLFDVLTAIVPGAGEAGAAADGAGAAARGAQEEAAGAAGRAGGKAAEAAGGLVSARGALTDITKTGGDLTKNLEGATGDLTEIKPPASGTPVALPPGKPFEAPVESAPRPPDAAPGAPQGSTPTTAPPGSPGAQGGPHGPDPAPAPPSPPGGAVGPQDPAPAPPSAPAGSGGPGGPHDPAPVPAVPPASGGPGAPGGWHDPAPVPGTPPGAGGPLDPGSAPAPVPAAGSPGDPGGPPVGPYDRPPEPPTAPPPPPETPVGPHDAGTAPPSAPAAAGDPNDPWSVPPGGHHEPHEPPPEPAGVQGEPVPATTPSSVPAALPAGVGEGLPKAAPHLAEAAPVVPSGSPSEPALVSAHASQPAGVWAPSAPSGGAPSFTAPGGHPSELPSPGGGGGGGWHGSGDGSPPGGDSPGKPPHGDGGGRGDGPPKDGSDDKTPDGDAEDDEPASQDPPQDADKPVAGRDYPLSPEQALQVLSDPQNEISRLANGKVPEHMLENYDPLAGRSPEEFARDFTVRDSSGKLKWDWDNQAPNNGFAGAPAELDHIPARLRLDRVGPNGGAFMCPEGEPLASRATPPGLASQYHTMSGSGDTVPDNWVVQHGPAKAAFGQPGGAEQWVVIDRLTGQPVPVEELDIAGVITDLTP